MSDKLTIERLIELITKQKTPLALERVPVTPEMGQMMMQHNHPNNRHRNARHMEEIAYTILEGGWRYNGEPFRFSNTGYMIDGQHRAEAVIVAGITVEADLKFGMPEDIIPTIDNNRARTPGDAFTWSGEKHGSVLSQAAKIVAEYLTGPITGHDLVTANHLLNVTLAEHPGLRESAEAFQKIRRRGAPKAIHNAHAVAFHYLFSRKDRRLADAFLTAMTQGGASAIRGSVEPVIEQNLAKLYDKLYANRNDPRREPKEFIAAYAIKTFNACVMSRPVLVMRYSKGSEAFPRILGVFETPVSDERRTCERGERTHA